MGSFVVSVLDNMSMFWSIDQAVIRREEQSTRYLIITGIGQAFLFVSFHLLPWSENICRSRLETIWEVVYVCWEGRERGAAVPAAWCM